MTTFIECDFCSRPIDPDDGYDAEEYNRMGFEGVSTDHTYVVMEGRYGDGRNRGTLEFGHFHYPDCWGGAVRLLHAHRRWAEERDAGPAAAVMPQWTGDELEEPELPARRVEEAVSAAYEADQQKIQRANGPDGIGNLRFSTPTYGALARADLVEIEAVRGALQDGKLAKVRGIGRKRVDEIVRALERYDREQAAESIRP